MLHGLFANNNEQPNLIEYYTCENILHKDWCERRPLTIDNLNSHNSIWSYIYQHREGLPAELSYYEDGTLHKEVWFNRGFTHNINTNDATSITYLKNGEYTKRWVNNGILYRANGLPPKVHYYSSGNVACETYFNAGRLKEVLYDLSGKIISIIKNGIKEHTRDDE